MAYQHGARCRLPDVASAMREAHALFTAAAAWFVIAAPAVRVSPWLAGPIGPNNGCNGQDHAISSA